MREIFNSLWSDISQVLRLALIFIESVLKNWQSVCIWKEILLVGDYGTDGFILEMDETFQMVKGRGNRFEGLGGERQLCFARM